MTINPQPSLWQEITWDYSIEKVVNVVNICSMILYDYVEYNVIDSNEFKNIHLIVSTQKF